MVQRWWWCSCLDGWLSAGSEFSIPQGSVLGPMIFVQDVEDVLDVFRHHGISHHLPADTRPCARLLWWMTEWCCYDRLKAINSASWSYCTLYMLFDRRLKYQWLRMWSLHSLLLVHVIWLLGWTLTFGSMPSLITVMAHSFVLSFVCLCCFSESFILEWLQCCAVN